MVRPILEYGSSVWDPHTEKLQEELDKVQNLATRFVTRNNVYETGSMAGILGQWARRNTVVTPFFKIFQERQKILLFFT